MCTLIEFCCNYSKYDREHFVIQVCNFTID